MIQGVCFHLEQYYKFHFLMIPHYFVQRLQDNLVLETENMFHLQVLNAKLKGHLSLHHHVCYHHRCYLHVIA